MRMFLRENKQGRFHDLAILEVDHPLVIGRTEVADVAFPHDNQMSSSHASITFRDGKCSVKDLGSTNGTFLNGKQIQEGILNPGDELRCGGTLLSVDSPDAPSGASAASATVASAALSNPAAVKDAAGGLPESLQQCQGFVSDTAAEIVERFQLEQSLAELPQEAESTIQFLTRLTMFEDSNDCLNFAAFALPKRCGIWWAVQCVRAEPDALGTADPELLDLVTQWVQQPSEQLRRQAMAAAEAVEMSTAASWTGVAAFWSHGSMGPADLAEVPAADEMAGKAISAAVVLATFAGNPVKAPARRKVFCELAVQVANGELSWK